MAVCKFYAIPLPLRYPHPYDSYIHALRFFFFFLSLFYSLVNYRSSDIDYLSKISRFVKEFINRKLDFRFFFLKKSREDSIFKKSTRIPERIFVSFPRRIKITLRAFEQQDRKCHSYSTSRYQNSSPFENDKNLSI